MRRFENIIYFLVIFLLMSVLVLTYFKFQVIAVIVTIVAIDIDCFGVWLRRQRKQVEAFLKVREKAKEDEMLLIDPQALEQGLSKTQMYIYKKYYKNEEKSDIE